MSMMDWYDRVSVCWYVTVMLYVPDEITHGTPWTAYHLQG